MHRLFYISSQRGVVVTTRVRKKKKIKKCPNRGKCITSVLKDSFFELVYNYFTFEVMYKIRLNNQAKISYSYVQ